MKIRWLGHSAIEIAGSATILIDPFISGNPNAVVNAAEITRADAIIITHDHGDHIGDSFEIAQKTGATIAAIYEIANEAASRGISVEPMNIGGTVMIAGAAISLVPAFHSSGLGGTAAGAIVVLDGKTIYHTGDTGLSLEMQLIGEVYKPDIVFLPIDGRFNMGTKLAAKAIELIKPEIAVPIHYDTFPLIQADPREFATLAEKYARIHILQPGQVLEF